MNNDTLLYQAAWQFAVTCLWPARQFSEIEIKITRFRIRQMIANSADRFNAYLEFCQQVLLFRYYSISSRGRVSIPSPCQWITGSGLTTSKLFFRSVQQRRLGEPLFMHVQKGLCEAVLEVTENNSEEMIAYWENWFRERNARPELRLFILYAAKFSTKTFQS